jgi:hypothetical protein
MAKTRGSRRGDYFRTGEDFREALCACVERAGSQSALSRMSGVPQSRISGLLSGKHVEMSPQTWRCLQRGVAMLSRDQRGSTLALRLQLDFAIIQPIRQTMPTHKGKPDRGGPIIQRPAVLPPIGDFIGAAADSRLRLGQMPRVLPNGCAWPVNKWVRVNRAQYECLRKNGVDLLAVDQVTDESFGVILAATPPEPR